MIRYVFAVVFVAAALTSTGSRPTPGPVVDLATDDGVRLVQGQWRYSDTRIVETDFREAGPDGLPTGDPVKTYDFTPHAGGADFDDSQWEVIAPSSLPQRRSTGRLCFNWYRIGITAPERIADFDTRGSNIIFETSIDDYAEIWVDGELTRAPGQSGGSVIAGWNAKNELLIARNVKPGQRIQLAIFGINGPISNPPTNFIFMRSALLKFERGEPGPVAITPAEANVEVKRLDPAINELIGPNPKIHKLADGFEFTEGPVWVRDGGHLLFSDPNANTIYKFVPGRDNSKGELTVFRKPSGYSGADIAEYKQPGSNGLALDPHGRLTINEHGNRRVTRIEKDGSVTVLADRFEGKRLNSPNDLVYRSDGALVFTDPPFGLPKFGDDPRKEIQANAVYSLHKGKLRQVSTELSGPNGIALSPDERYLYVANWDDKRKVVLRYEVTPEATLENGALFIDMTGTPGEDALDGMKVDQRGNLYVSGPGALWILSPEGKRLGTVIMPKHPHNFAWGDEDGKTLYICARSGLYKMRFNVPGVRPAGSSKRIVVVELFTSEGCSSCPPADRLLAELDETQPVAGVQVVALSERVDYWNRLGWTDPFSSPIFSRRQEGYSRRFGLDGVYTPQLIVDGSAQMVGSDRGAVFQALRRAGAQRAAVNISLENMGGSVKVTVDPAPGSVNAGAAELFAALVEDPAPVQVTQGENNGRRLRHVGVVRELASLGFVDLSRKTVKERRLASGSWDRKRVAAFVQLKGHGPIVGAASLPLRAAA
jgi:gluconolactonase